MDLATPLGYTPRRIQDLRRISRSMENLNYGVPRTKMHRIEQPIINNNSNGSSNGSGRFAIGRVVKRPPFRN